MILFNTVKKFRDALRPLTINIGDGLPSGRSFRFQKTTSFTVLSAEIIKVVLFALIDWILNNRVLNALFGSSYLLKLNSQSTCPVCISTVMLTALVRLQRAVWLRSP